MKTTKTLSLILGAMSLAFGLLKFTNPFKTWYTSQIETSGLPEAAYPLGIAVEIITGLLLLLPFLIKTSIILQKRMLLLGNFLLISTMIAATYVHMIPEVPAEVLPMKIKPPVIPLMVLFAAVVNMIYTLKQRPYKSM